MQTYQSLISELKHSPQLPAAIEELNAYWKAEQQKRLQFLEELDENVEAEFIEGEIVLHSPALEKHNAVVSNLEFILQAYIQPRGLGRVRVEKAMVHLTRNNFEPDLAFWSSAKDDTIGGNTLLYPAPDWACEVLSSATSKRDRGIKMTDYATHDVAEYWIIDPDKMQVEQFLLEKDAFELVLKSKNGMIESKVIAGLSFPIEAIFNLELRLAAVQRFLTTK